MILYTQLQPNYNHIHQHLRIIRMRTGLRSRDERRGYRVQLRNLGKKRRERDGYGVGATMEALWEGR